MITSERFSFFVLGAASAATSIVLLQRFFRPPSKTHGEHTLSNNTTRIMSNHNRNEEKKDRDSSTDGTCSRQASFPFMTSVDSTATSSTVADESDAATDKMWDAPDLELRLLRKAETVIRLRSMGLTVVIERCTNDHNYSAILRTAEALGVQNVAIVDSVNSQLQNLDRAMENEEDENTKGQISPKDGNHDDDDEKNGLSSETTDKNETNSRDRPKDHDKSKVDTKKKKVELTAQEMEQHQMHHLFAQNATEWLTITEYDTTRDCVQALKDSGHQVWVTDLSQEAVPLVPEALQLVEGNSCWPLPNKLAIVFGTEAVGCSHEMLDLADLRVYLPLRGFADSLNLSVATALVLHHLFLLHPSYAGSSTEAERLALRQLWFPKLAQQRLLSSREKKERRRLLQEIAKCQRLQAKLDEGSPLLREQHVKLQQLEAYETRLAELEIKAKYNDTASNQAFQEWIRNPPEPLCDLRRPDSHRVTFVGKTTKKYNQEHWGGMVATSNVQSTYHATATFFRQFTQPSETNASGTTM